MNQAIFNKVVFNYKDSQRALWKKSWKRSQKLNPSLTSNLGITTSFCTKQAVQDTCVAQYS